MLHPLRRQQEARLRRRDAVDPPDAVQGGAEGGEAFGVEFGDQVPAAVGRVDLLDLRNLGLRREPDRLTRLREEWRWRRKDAARRAVGLTISIFANVGYYCRMEEMSPDLREALAADPKARATWDGLRSLARRDFISWIESARQAQTRRRRALSVPDRLASGKRRPCCYAVVPLNVYTALNKNAQAKAKWKELTPDQKRDFSDWVEAATSTDLREDRMTKLISSIAAGKTRP